MDPLPQYLAVLFFVFVITALRTPAGADWAEESVTREERVRLMGRAGWVACIHGARRSVAGLAVFHEERKPLQVEYWNGLGVGLWKIITVY